VSNFSFRPASRSNAKPLIGLYAESGKGKTTSALMLACGFVGGDMSKVGMIETEAGRGEANAGDPVIGGYQVLSLSGDFSPANYGKAIQAAEQARLSALIIDSASHEWEGAGGVLSMAADNQAAGKKGPIVWQRPKMEHQREFMLRIMQTPIPLVIVCMRAKYPMKEIPVNGKKEWTRSKELEPKQADDILFEMFIHGWIDDSHNFHGTKYTLDELRQVIKSDEPISVNSGKRLAAWASGAKEPPPRLESKGEDTRDVPAETPELADGAGPIDDGYLTPDQASHLEAELSGIPKGQERFLKAASKKYGREIKSLRSLPSNSYESALSWVAQANEKAEQS